jgi:uncharacterized membrane protein
MPDSKFCYFSLVSAPAALLQTWRDFALGYIQSRCFVTTLLRVNVRNYRFFEIERVRCDVIATWVAALRANYSPEYNGSEEKSLSVTQLRL